MLTSTIGSMHKACLYLKSFVFVNGMDSKRKQSKEILQPDLSANGSNGLANLLVENEQIRVPFSERGLNAVSKIHLDHNKLNRYLEILDMEISRTPATIELDPSKIKAYVKLLNTRQQSKPIDLISRSRIKLMKGSNNYHNENRRETQFDDDPFNDNFKNQKTYNEKIAKLCEEGNDMEKQFFNDGQKVDLDEDTGKHFVNELDSKIPEYLNDNNHLYDSNLFSKYIKDGDSGIIDSMSNYKNNIPRIKRQNNQEKDAFIENSIGKESVNEGEQSNDISNSLAHEKTENKLMNPIQQGETPQLSSDYQPQFEKKTETGNMNTVVSYQYQKEFENLKPLVNGIENKKILLSQYTGDKDRVSPFKIAVTDQYNLDIKTVSPILNPGLFLFANSNLIQKPTPNYYILLTTPLCNQPCGLLANKLHDSTKSVGIENKIIPSQQEAVIQLSALNNLKRHSPSSLKSSLSDLSSEHLVLSLNPNDEIISAPKTKYFKECFSDKGKGDLRIPTKPTNMYSNFYLSKLKNIQNYNENEDFHDFMKKPISPQFGTRENEVSKIINVNLEHLHFDKGALYKIIGKALKIDDENKGGDWALPQWLANKYDELMQASHRGQTLTEVASNDQVEHYPVFPRCMLARNGFKLEENEESLKEKQNLEQKIPLNKENLKDKAENDNTIDVK